MKYSRKRYLWLAGILTGVAALLGLLAIQIANAQAPHVDLEASPTSLPTTPGGAVNVTITYEITGSTQLFYYPPHDFDVIEDAGATPDRDSKAQPPFDGTRRLKWEVSASGSKVVVLQVKEGATPGEKPHRAALSGNNPSDAVLNLTMPPDPQPALTPDLRITDVRKDRESVEPGQSFNVTVTFQNKGNGPANEVVLELSGDQGFSNLQSDKIGPMDAGAELTKSYSIGTLADLEDSDYSISITLQNGLTTHHSENLPASIRRPPQDPEIEMVRNNATISDSPGMATLVLEFHNSGAPLPRDAQLVLRYPENTLLVQEATVNGVRNPGDSQADNGSHAWRNLPSFDWKNEGELVLEIQLQVNPGLSQGSRISVSFISNAGNNLSDSFDLSPDTIADLAQGVSSPTLTPAVTPTPGTSPTDEPVEATSEGEESDVQATAEGGETETIPPGSELIPTPTPTPTPTGGGEGRNWLMIVVIGGGGVLLLLLAIAGFSWLRSRGQATPPTIPQPAPLPGTPPITGTLPPAVAGGQPYLRSSNGRIFPITFIPFTIGRGPGNGLIIDESFMGWETVSRSHARIVQHPQGYVIEDQGSQNKLRVQGRLTERNLLRNGWRLHVGGVEFTFYDGPSTPGGIV